MKAKRLLSGLNWKVCTVLTGARVDGQASVVQAGPSVDHDFVSLRLTRLVNHVRRCEPCPVRAEATPWNPDAERTILPSA